MTINATMARATTINAGMNSFLGLKVTVISFEVVGFLLGTIFSVVGIPSSNLANSERSSSAL